jgi:hypothetical protein
MWTDEQAQQVAALLQQFNGADEVCSVTNCKPDDLDANARDAFGCDFEQAHAVFAVQGCAMLREALMEQALMGNVKALDMRR